MTWTRRRIALHAGLFAALMLLGGWPWPGVARAFSALYCPFGNLIVGHQTFGYGGHARLAPLDRIARQASDNVTADASIALTVDGFQGDMRLGVSLRRDAYLPLLIAIALIAAAPLALGRQLRSLAIAVPLLLLWTAAVFQLLVIWTFATQLRGIYTSSPLQQRLVDLAYGALLAPPGNRFIAPIVLAIGTIAWQARRSDKSCAPVTEAPEAKAI
jgi:hypothetical protein